MNILTVITFVGPLHDQVMQELTQLGNFPNHSNQEVYDNTNNPWYDTPAAYAKLKWLVRGLRVLAGFTAGFIVGGLLTGGNLVVGAAAGTVTGAGSSAAD